MMMFGGYGSKLEYEYTNSTVPVTSAGLGYSFTYYSYIAFTLITLPITIT
jgi:hypothetical protein